MKKTSHTTKAAGGKSSVVYIKPKMHAGVEPAGDRSTKRVDVRRFKRPLGLFILSALFVCVGIVGIVRLRPAFHSMQLPRIGAMMHREQNDAFHTSEVGTVRFADPYSVLSEVKKHDTNVVLIDMRPKKTYEKAYIRGSVNVPFPQRGNSKESDMFVNAVTKVAHGKTIVLMPFSSSSTSGEEAFKLLNSRVKNVSVLKIGWNELFNLPNMWLPEDEWKDFDFQGMVEYK